MLHRVTSNRIPDVLSQLKTRGVDVIRYLTLLVIEPKPIEAPPALIILCNRLEKTPESNLQARFIKGINNSLSTIG